MKHLPSLIILFIICIGCSLSEKKQKSDDNKLGFGVIDSLKSNILNEQRKIWVYTPPDSTKKYPLLVLLDGDAHYYSVAGMIHQLSTINGNTVCPEMVIVAIPNTDRTRDLTPYRVKAIFGDTTFAKTSGGGENFAKFIGEELIPYVDKKYPTTSHRTLIGHSFGGLFAVNTLMHYPDMFANYLAIDPSLWWDDQKFGVDAAKALSAGKYQNKSLYVAMANTMPANKTLEDMKKDTTKNTQHIRSIIRFTEEMWKVSNGLQFESKYYPKDDHSSVPLIAEYDALHSFFSWYKLDGVNDFFDPVNKATAEDLVKLLTTHYEIVSQRFGYTVLPPEGNVNNIGYALLRNGFPEKAFACFELNIKNYPESANVFDSMGDYYVNRKDTANAIVNFEKALSITKNDNTQEKLSKLQKSK